VIPALCGLPTLTVFSYAIHRLALKITNRPASELDAYLDQVDADLRSGRSRLVTHPVDAGLDEDLHWAGLEGEWLRFVQGLPTTRETL